MTDQLSPTTPARRVVITGTGAICSVGNTAPEVWAALKAGTSGIAPITRFDPTIFETRFAGEVKGFDPAEQLGRKEHRRLDRYSQLAIVAAREAVVQSGLEIAPEATRVGVLMATAMGGMETFETGTELMLTQGPRRVSPFFVPMMLANMAAGTVAIDLGTKGPNFATVSACASAGHAIGEGVQMIRDGRADAIVAGGAEAPVTRMGITGYNAMDALSTRNDDPAAASRPFDSNRDGFVLAEGAAAIVIEEREHAIARGATILGEVIGYATTDDANHIVQPGPEGEGIARAMELALTDAGIDRQQIGYINAHGTSTQMNEKFETMGYKRVFGDVAYQIPISSTKSMTGHLLGAAGSLEAVISTHALLEGILPPTINQTDPDPDCDLDYIPNVARQSDAKVAMSNSMGFGGHNVSLIFAHPDFAR
ncbi:MAG TPA: beta-ketoacyl-ACP synthase II [Thermomicrobiales bacterium]|nr:beta-ketoacyl-ACP synthase II [Thermomicrobiales bacterium]